MMKSIIRLVILLLSMPVSVQIAYANDPVDLRQDKKTRFAVIGDMPYSDAQHAMLSAPNGTIYAAIRKLNPPVLIHLGDFKNSLSTCRDELFEERYTQISQLNPHKVVYTPGDNDWTDCDRLGQFPRFDELERLSFLRQLFFHDDKRQLTRNIPELSRQPGFIENATWRIDDIQFATLHIPGTNNGRKKIYRSDINQALDEADFRDQSNEQWLLQLFESAQHAQAVVIAFQADIYHAEMSRPACSPTNRTNCDGYKQLRALIAKQARLYKKPILVIHGDTVAYCLHQPYTAIPNLWRLNAAGDYKVLDANQVTFNPKNIDAPFEVTGLLDQQKVPEICDHRFINF